MTQLITVFNQDTLDIVRGVLKIKLDEIFKETGVKFNIGGMRFDRNEFTCKLTALTVNPDSKFANISVMDIKVAKDFCEKAYLLGLNPQELNTSKMLNGEKYTLIGYLTKSKRYPLLMRKGSKRMKITVDFWKKGTVPPPVKPAESLDAFLGF